MLKVFLCFVFITTLSACQQDNGNTSTALINKMQIENTESQAVTNEGLVVAAEDLNQGNVMLFWSSNYAADDRFRIYLYVSKQAEITDYQSFVATQLCNIPLVQCSPQKQTRCQIDNGLFYCLAQKGRGFRIDSVLNHNQEAIAMWMTLRVCPFDAMADDSACAQESRQFVLAKKCSQYLYSPCLDQDPLQVTNFEIRGLQAYENDLPILDNNKTGRIKFYPSWQSSWVSQPYNFRLDLVDSRESNNRITLLQSICNQRLKCKGAAQIQCSLNPNKNGASITCLGNPQEFEIKHLDERHPDQDIKLDFELTIDDDLFQQQTVLSTSALLKI